MQRFMDRMRRLAVMIMAGGSLLGAAGCSDEGLLGSQYVTPGPSVSSAPHVTVVPPSLVGASTDGARRVDDVERQLVGLLQGDACLEPDNTAMQLHEVWSRWFAARDVTASNGWTKDESFQRVVVGPVAAYQDLCPAAAVSRFRHKLTELDTTVAQSSSLNKVWAARNGTNS